MSSFAGRPNAANFSTCASAMEKNSFDLSRITTAVLKVLAQAPGHTSCLLAATLLGAPAIAYAMPASVDLSDLDGSNGFIINGIDVDDKSGYSVSGAGDINGDGVDDLIVGAYGADPNGNSKAGESYVVFGGSGVASSGAINLFGLNGGNGFVINGVDIDDRSGHSVSGAGDINGDGVDDLIIGAFDADSNISGVGKSYVVFGGGSVGSSGTINLSALTGSNGFVINGIDFFDWSGISVSSAGDINGDGVDDLIIGAFIADPNGIINAGESYVVFGGNGVGGSGSINLSALNGSNGFVLNGIDAGDVSGRSVSSAGDINGDDVDDLIIGAVGPNNETGTSYVVFGGIGIGSSGSINLSALTGSNGFVIGGIDTGDRTGRSVSGLGDINGDGVDDLIIGAYLADPEGKSEAGESYVLFGGDSIGANGSISAATLTGSNGFVINGIDVNDWSGRAVSDAGDFNGDGIADIIIGAMSANPNGKSLAGESYVLFGSSVMGANGAIDLASLDGNNGLVINGIDDFDMSGISVSNAGDFNGDGVDDLIIGASGAAPNGSSYAGESYVVFGSSNAPVQTEVNIVTSCLAGNGRVDLNIVNTQTASSVYRLEFGSLNAREVTVSFEDWGRLPITGRLPNTYSAVIKRDGVVILDTDITIDCSAVLPPISTPEVTIVNACRGTTANKGQVFFQIVNSTATSRPYVIEFENVANRSTTAAAFGQSRRGTTGRPDGTYTYKVRTGSTLVDTGQVIVDCN